MEYLGQAFGEIWMNLQKYNEDKEKNILSFSDLFIKISIPLEKTNLEYHQNCRSLNVLGRILTLPANFSARRRWTKKITENTLIDNRNIVPNEPSNRPENAFRKPRQSPTLDGTTGFRRKRFKVLIVLHDSLPIDHTSVLCRIRSRPRVPGG